MLRLTALVISIGLADSLNPTTIGPALYLAGGKRPRTEVAEFTLAVFAVYLVGGLAIALGIGQAILSLVPSPDAEDRHVIETAVGAMLLASGVFLWAYRRQLAKRSTPTPKREGRSSAILGATITAVELPTAFPYFAAIAAIVGSGLSVPKQITLLLLFNVCFVMPLLGIVGTLWFAGDHAERLLTIGRNFLQRHWPVILAGLALIAGVFVLALGATGFAGAHSRSRFGRFMHQVHGVLHP
jgi:cytochrome c biogenesis protein CcdA